MNSIQFRHEYSLLSQLLNKVKLNFHLVEPRINPTCITPALLNCVKLHLQYCVSEVDNVFVALLAHSMLLGITIVE